MTASVRESMLAFLCEKLEMACPGYVQRSRVTPIRRFPAIIVRPSTESVVNHQFDRSDRDLIVEIEVHQKGESATLQDQSGVVSDEAADDVLNTVHATVLEDTRVGGYAVQIAPIDIEWQYASAEQPRALVTLRYNIRYRHEFRDLTKQL